MAAKICSGFRENMAARKEKLSILNKSCDKEFVIRNCDKCRRPKSHYLHLRQII